VRSLFFDDQNESKQKKVQRSSRSSLLLLKPQLRGKEKGERERERERNFSFFFFLCDVNRPTKTMNLRSVTRDFRPPCCFSWSSFSQKRGGISPRGKKREKNTRTPREFTHNKKKNKVFLHFNNALVVFLLLLLINNKNARTCRKRTSHLFVKHIYARSRKRSSRARSRGRRRRRERKGTNLDFYGNMTH